MVVVHTVRGMHLSYRRCIMKLFALTIPNLFGSVGVLSTRVENQSPCRLSELPERCMEIYETNIPQFCHPPGKVIFIFDVVV
jgi:hypothetical protein